MKYVLGFAVDGAETSVLLVEKQHGPPINHGKWNGVGGKVDGFEDPMVAMKREWREETDTISPVWVNFGYIFLPGNSVSLYKCTTDAEVHDTQNDVGEELLYHEVDEILNPLFFGYTWAQNVPTMIQHILSGEGKLHLFVN